jgi:heptosyltransferase-1
LSEAPFPIAAAESRRSILIIKPSSLGDIVHTLPAVALIRDAHPDAIVTWVINPEWAPLLRGNRGVDHVHIFPRGEFRGFGMPATALRWWWSTRKMKPDAALDFQGLLRSALIGRVSRPREFFGMSDAREGARWFYNRVAPVERGAHAVERYLALAATFGAPIHRPLRFPLPTGDPVKRFDEHVPFVLLHPFARGQRKSLNDLVIDEFCRALAPTRVVVAGQSKRTFSVPENCISMVNQTSLLQLIWLIRAARFTVSVDSGPMHIASAISDRLISIHTWSDPRRVGPYNQEAWVWKNRELCRVRDLPPPAKRKSNRGFRPADVRQLLPLLQESLNL